MAKQIAVLGLGRFGWELALELVRLGDEVLAVDRDEALVQGIADQVTKAATADITDLETLRQLGVGQMEVGVVATGELEASVLATQNLKSLGVAAIYAKASNERHATILRGIGAQRAVQPEREGGERFAHEIRARAIVDYLPLIPGYGVALVEPPASWVGETLERVAEARGRGRLLMLVRGDAVQLNPVRSQAIEAGDRLVVAGTDADLGQEF